MLTPTPVNIGERPRTLERQSGPFSPDWCTSLNVAERRAVGSKPQVVSGNTLIEPNQLPRPMIQLMR
jgi:hypothetical protein